MANPGFAGNMSIADFELNIYLILLRAEVVGSYFDFMALGLCPC